MTRLIAFDISGNPGVAVIDIKTNKAGKQSVSLVLADSVSTNSKSPDSQRFAYIEAFAVKTIHEYGPFDIVLREHFTKGGNKRSTQLVFGAWAAIDGALGRYGYEIDAEPTPTEVKKVVGGHGKADKAEVEAGVRKLLGLAEDYVFRTDDESDAVAIGLTYLIKKNIIKGA